MWASGGGGTIPYIYYYCDAWYSTSLTFFQWGMFWASLSVGIVGFVFEVCSKVKICLGLKHLVWEWVIILCLRGLGIGTRCGEYVSRIKRGREACVNTTLGEEKLYILEESVGGWLGVWDEKCDEE